jgi:hypothetical protein
MSDCSFSSVARITLGFRLYAWQASQMICEADFTAPPWVPNSGHEYLARTEAPSPGSGALRNAWMSACDIELTSRQFSSEITFSGS